MPNTDPQSWLPLAPQDLQLLLALSAEPLHGYAMIRQVERQSGGRVRVELGSLYRMLHRLERDGLIEEVGGAGGAVTPGRERRCYRTTRHGRAVVSAEVDRLRGLIDLARRLRPGEAGT